MVRKAIPVDLRTAAVFVALEAAAKDGQRVNVTAWCREHGVSRQAFYEWKAKYVEGGLDGLLEERSRRPHRSPRRTPAEVEEAIVALRKELVDAGLDGGPASIRFHLARRRLAYPPPAEATIWRVLTRRGFITPEPRKRPKSACCRFEAAFPNQCWQIDATEWNVANRTVWIFNVLDDHSRLAVNSLAVTAATSEAAWAAFSQGCARWGVPRRCLSDNGLQFSGKLRGFEVFFEEELRRAGIEAVTARPYHPQTCGKVERFQQTLKKWLRAQDPFTSLDALQDALDGFCAYYNHERPHRGIGRVPPHERWAATPRVASTGQPLPPPAILKAQLAVNRHGQVDFAIDDQPQFRAALGIAHAGKTADVLLDHDHVAVFINSRLVRYFQLDRSHRFQPLHTRPGRPTTNRNP